MLLDGLQPLGVLGLQLLVGSMGQAADGALLDEYGITHVLCCCGGDVTDGRVAPLVTPTGRHIVHAAVAAEDDEEYPLLHGDVTVTAMRFLLDAVTAAPHHRVLVHCRAGMNRSAALALAFATVVSGRDRAFLLSTLRLTRPWVMSNKEFVEQLARLDTAAWRVVLALPAGDAGVAAAEGW